MAYAKGIRRCGSAMALVVTMALATSALPAMGATLYGLTAGGTFLIRFDSATPGTITDAAALTGLQAGERIVGIDFRPRTGQLFGVGIVEGATDTVRAYVIDPTSGAASLVPGSTSFTVTHGTQYGIAFNPTVDRLRVVNNADENFRVNPNNGARADTPTNDTDLNPAGNAVLGVAYDRSFDTGLAVANRTTAYGISRANSSLVTIGGINQSPSPNGGAIMNSQALGLTLSAASDIGFDIDVDSNTAFAALTNNANGLNGLYTINLGTGAATLVGSIANGGFSIGGLAVAPPNLVAIGADSGFEPRVRVFDPSTGIELFSFLAYGPTVKKGVRVALGDVTFDSVPDIITGPGKGTTSEIHVFDGTTGQPLVGPLGTLLAFADPKFKGGVFVAAGDVNGDGNKDVIVGTGPGAPPEVKVFSGATGGELVDFVPYDATFKGGVQVAAADFDRDGDCEIVTGPGKGAAPEVRLFDSAGSPFTSASLPNLPNQFLAYDAKFKGGVFVAAGDVNGDGVADVVTGAGKGGAPQVVAFSGVDGTELARFLALEPKRKSGVRVALADVDGDGRLDILASPGSGRAPTEVRAFDGITLEEKTRYLAFDQKFGKGAFVGGARR
jgi:hypothetical protein